MLYMTWFKISTLWDYYVVTTTSVYYSETNLFMMIILAINYKAGDDGKTCTTTRNPNTETLSISTDIATTSGGNMSLTTTGDIEGVPEKVGPLVLKAHIFCITHR